MQICLKFLDTPQYQRLRNIRQLGVVRYVYPGGTHDRFTHSLGVCYIANELLDHLMQIQPALNVTELEREAVCLAGEHVIGKSLVVK